MTLCSLMYSNKPRRPRQNSWIYTETKLHTDGLHVLISGLLKAVVLSDFSVLTRCRTKTNDGSDIFKADAAERNSRPLLFRKLIQVIIRRQNINILKRPLGGLCSLQSRWIFLGAELRNIGLQMIFCWTLLFNLDMLFKLPGFFLLPFLLRFVILHFISLPFTPSKTNIIFILPLYLLSSKSVQFAPADWTVVIALKGFQIHSDPRILKSDMKDKKKENNNAH